MSTSPAVVGLALMLRNSLCFLRCRELFFYGALCNLGEVAQYFQRPALRAGFCHETARARFFVFGLLVVIWPPAEPVAAQSDERLTQENFPVYFGSFFAISGHLYFSDLCRRFFKILVLDVFVCMAICDKYIDR